ncbi:MAG TPA: APC family permease [Acidobacteriaceae bacterium]|nr:APC family permease [Acidobacteriaceae bacterium]
MSGARVTSDVSPGAGRNEVAPMERGVDLRGAISTNILNMVGIGPFLTIPLALAAMGGPQAILGWIAGALISLCDGMVWAELGSSMPLSGGPYYYLREAFGPLRLGSLVSFLFLWQTVLIGPISIASGAVGFAQYSRYLVPAMHGWQLPVLAAVVCLLNTVLLLRRIQSINGLSIVISAIVLATTLGILISGVIHFHPSLAFAFPPGAFHLSHPFFVGLGAATLIAVYDYGGYYNVCMIGEEVRNPRRTIPRSILISIVLVAVLYLAMNISILGVIPWREAMHSDAIVALFIERLYGPLGAKISSVLILVATFGSVFAILLGFSRVPYAAAGDGHFFKVFARLHPRGGYPIVAVVTMGILSALACIFSLSDLISMLIVVQTMLQFMLQCVAVMVLRKRAIGGSEAFRMPFFPLPALIALAGWTYIVVTSGARYIEIGLALLLLGVAAFMLRSWRTQQWPFTTA